MKRIVSLLVFVSNISLAQNVQIDSLNNILYSEHISDKTKAVVHIALSRLYYQLSYDSMIFHSQKALNIAEVNNLSEEKAQALKLQGIVLAKLGKTDSALTQYKKSLALFSKVNSILDMSKVLNNMAGIYRSINQFDSSLNHYDASFKIKERLNDLRGMAVIYANKALLYRENGIYDSAQNLYLRALPLAEKLKDVELKVKINLGQAIIYEYQNDTTNAIFYYDLAIKESRNNKLQVYLADGLNNLAELHIVLRNYTKALNLLKESLAISETLNNIRVQAIVKTNIGVIYTDLGQLKIAEQYLSGSLDDFIEMDDKNNIAKVKVAIARIAKLQKKYQRASDILMECLKISNSLNEHLQSALIVSELIEVYDQQNRSAESIYWRDSLFKLNEVRYQQTANKELFFLQTRFKVAKNENLIKSLEYTNRLKSERLSKLTIGMISLIMIVILLAALIYYLKQTKVVKHQKELLQQEQLEERLQFKERELVTSTMLLVRKNDELEQIKSELEGIDLTVSDKAKTQLTKVIKNISRSSRMEKDWEVFKTHFENANEGFLKRLSTKLPNLTSSEVKLFTYIKMNMSNKEIAQLNHVSLHAIEKSRSRLRKKIGLDGRYDLYQFVQSI